MRDWAEQQLALLQPQYEGRFELWFVRLYPTGTSWHARPVGARCATIRAETPEDLVAAIAEHETSLLGGKLRHGAGDHLAPSQAERPVDM